MSFFSIIERKLGARRRSKSPARGSSSLIGSSNSSLAGPELEVRGPAVNHGISGEEHHIENSVGIAIVSSIASQDRPGYLHPDLAIQNPIHANVNREENHSFRILAGLSTISPINGLFSARHLAKNTEGKGSIDNVVRPSDSIGRPLPLIKFEPPATQALTSEISTGNNLIPSSTHEGETAAGTNITVGSLTLWNLAVSKLGAEDRKTISGSREDINLVQSFVGEIKKKQEQCNRKRWFYTNKEGENVFFIDILAKQLNKYAMIGDIAIQHDPTIVALAWSGFRFLLQVATAYTEDMQTASESLEYLLRILFCCDIYEKLYCKTDLLIVQALSTSLVELYVSILEYLCCVKRFLSKNTGGRVLRSFVSRMTILLENVHKKETAVLSYVDKAEKEASATERNERKEETERLKKQLKDIKKPLDNIENLVEKVYEEMQKDRKLEVLSWLSNIKFIDHHLFSKTRRQENTGQWLKENETYKEWRNSRSSSLLWLRGDAGYGKTTLVSFVIDELQIEAKTNENVLAYFYCNYKEDNRRRPETVLRTLVKQFCLKSPGDPKLVPVPVSSIYEERERHGHASGELRCQESTELIISLSKMYHQVTIVVDALDECYQGTRRDLFLSLKSIVKSGSNVKVFLASRFEQDIALMFEGYKCHYIQASDNTKDINNYIDLQLDIRCDPQNCGVEELLLDGDVDDQLKEEISQTLKEKANGMFMWVNLQILALCEEPTAGCVREALKKLPKDLKETYDRIIKRTEARPSSSRIAKKVLSWLLYAQEPCSLQTIRQALAVGPGEDKFDQDVLRLTLSRVVDYCKNLVVDDMNTQNLRFAHFSVQEYLYSNEVFRDLSINHTTMAEICLKALLYHHSGSKPRQNVGSLKKYAIKHWATHLRLSGPLPQTSVLYKMGIEFLKPSNAYNEWASIVKEEGDPFKLSSGMAGFVSPSWVAFYYRLYDFLGVGACSKKILNEPNQHGWTPLLWAAMKGHDKVVELLLQDGRADINKPSQGGQTPLSLAAQNGRNKVVELLLEDSRTYVNKPSQGGQTPLSLAAENGQDKVVKLLLQDGRTNVNIEDEARQTPLLLAAENGRNKVVELFLQDSHTDVNKAGRAGPTPLILAVMKGHDKVVELLLQDSRTYVNKPSQDGRTPLSLAAENGQGKVVELLLQDIRTNVNIVSQAGGRTPLAWAVVKGHDKVVKLLLQDSRTDVNKAGRGEPTPLILAVTKGHDKVVELLLQDSRTDVNKPSQDGRTPLSLAAEHGQKKMVELLLQDSRTDVNKAGQGGWTPYSMAAMKGHDGVVELLLQDSRTNVNKASKHGWTAPHTQGGGVTKR